eukprot:TRINITY_DN4570_c0_g1_i1.p1 TRINITY_DN4570_c0_g1~~TRINITY_DN4570_c0_g1_i1.p1  ORF type:complete len:364 (-),score=50.88 TRINITY_DN4570_c0_g1_i1:146-1237(-)
MLFCAVDLEAVFPRLMLAQWAYHVFFSLLRGVHSQAATTPPVRGAKLVVFVSFFGFAYFLHACRKACRAVSDLPQVVKTFDVRKVDCYCCTCNHVCPRTQERIPCDRKVVHRALERWFGGGTIDSDTLDRLLAGDSFESETNLTFFNDIVQKLDVKCTLNIRYLQAAIACAPACCAAWDAGATLAVQTGQLEVGLRYTLDVLCQCFCLGPTTLLLQSMLLSRIEQLACVRRIQLGNCASADYLLTVALTLQFVLMYLLLQLPGRVLREPTAPLAHQVQSCTCYLLVTICVYRAYWIRPSSCCRRRTAQAGKAEWQNSGVGGVTVLGEGRDDLEAQPERYVAGSEIVEDNSSQRVGIGENVISI